MILIFKIIGILLLALFGMLILVFFIVLGFTTTINLFDDGKTKRKEEKKKYRKIEKRCLKGKHKWEEHKSDIYKDYIGDYKCVICNSISRSEISTNKRGKESIKIILDKKSSIFKRIKKESNLM